MSVSSSISDGEMKTDERLPGTADVQGSAWSPFRHAIFAVLWVATVVSNIGSWMQNAAAGWLMTTLRPDPFEVALVQAATTLPMFLVSLPAGALADHYRPPPASDRGADRSGGNRRPVCDLRMAELGHA
jgi:MFS family permease